jgi:hypothetical protein
MHHANDLVPDSLFTILVPSTRCKVCRQNRPTATVTTKATSLLESNQSCENTFFLLLFIFLPVLVFNPLPLFSELDYVAASHPHDDSSP